MRSTVAGKRSAPDFIEIDLTPFFAVLVTGKWPESLRVFVVGVMRWTMRVNAYVMFLTDAYPPFSLQ
jgi:hypothetical protein